MQTRARLVFILLSAALAGTARAETKKFWHTYPQPPRPTVSDPLARLWPSDEVPQDPDKYLWRITNKVNGKEVTTGSVRVFGFDSMDHGGRIGDIAAGTTVRLLAHRQINGNILYMIPYEHDTGGKNVATATVGWVEGIFIEVAGMNPNPGAGADNALTSPASAATKTATKPLKASTKSSAKATPAK